MTEKERFFWNKLLELAKEELTQATFDYYVLDTKLIKVQDNVATILLEEVKKTILGEKHAVCHFAGWI